MRRLLQIGTFLFILVATLAPLTEFLDRWDAPGLSSDTEFATFALIFIFCLILLVSKLVSVFAQQIPLIAFRYKPPSEPWMQSRSESFSKIVPSLNSPPLRI